MSRLIDADVFEVVCFQGKSEEFCEGAKYILEMLDAQPTAYDVEKVMTDLETLRIDKCNYFGVLNVVAEKYDRANEMLDDAINIVRKGGVE